MTVFLPSVGGAMPRLAHPVELASLRRVTQAFGARPEYYRQFVIGGVPLRGHEGIDFGTPVGSWVVAVDGGVATEVIDQGARGYGRYVKLVHGWGESVYAHLDTFAIAQGQRVAAGERIGRSGNTGNSSGPHLHFGLRVHPYDRSDGWGGYSDPAPYLAAGEIRLPVDVPMDVPGVLRRAAREVMLEEELLLSLGWAESSFDPLVGSWAGAQGLLQIMPATWEEWAPRVGARDPFEPLDNARVGAAYLQWCIRQAGGVYRGLIAYNWGIGNLLAGREVPQATVIFARSVIHGRDLLRAVG